MKKVKLNQFTAALLMICLVFITSLDNVNAGVNTVKDFKGKVVFQDDGGNVSGGVIEVFLYSNDDDAESLLEKVSVDPNGEFVLSKVNGIQTDRIKIMCYPNDLDNLHTGYEVTEVRLSEAKKDVNKTYDLIIEVKRTDKNDRQD